MRFPRENDFDALILEHAQRRGVPLALMKAIIGKESQFHSTAKALTGPDGARGGSYGLMQMSFTTARALGFKGEPVDLLTPDVNLELGAHYLADLMHEAAAGGYGIDSVISAYNGGNSAYRRGDGKRVGSIAHAPPDVARRVPVINQAYVDDVMRLLDYFARPLSAP